MALEIGKTQTNNSMINKVKKTAIRTINNNTKNFNLIGFFQTCWTAAPISEARYPYAKEVKTIVTTTGITKETNAITDLAVMPVWIIGWMNQTALYGIKEVQNMIEPMVATATKTNFKNAELLKESLHPPHDQPSRKYRNTQSIYESIHFNSHHPRSLTTEVLFRKTPIGGLSFKGSLRYWEPGSVYGGCCVISSAPWKGASFMNSGTQVFTIIISSGLFFVLVGVLSDKYLDHLYSNPRSFQEKQGESFHDPSESNHHAGEKEVWLACL